jgi:hypothetical protein
LQKTERLSAGWNLLSAAQAGGIVSGLASFLARVDGMQQGMACREWRACLPISSGRPAPLAPQLLPNNGSTVALSLTLPLPQVCLLTNPIWLIKTRMQLQTKVAAAAGAVPYKGLWDALVQIGRSEGLRGYYKGLGPSLVLVRAALGLAAASRN